MWTSSLLAEHPDHSSVGHVDLNAKPAVVHSRSCTCNDRAFFLDVFSRFKFSSMAACVFLAHVNKLRAIHNEHLMIKVASGYPRCLLRIIYR